MRRSVLTAPGGGQAAAADNGSALACPLSPSPVSPTAIAVAAPVDAQQPQPQQQQQQPAPADNLEDIVAVKMFNAAAHAVRESATLATIARFVRACDAYLEPPRADKQSVRDGWGKEESVFEMVAMFDGGAARDQCGVF
jgi:hypothetical protein